MTHTIIIKSNSIILVDLENLWFMIYALLKLNFKLNIKKYLQSVIQLTRMNF